MTKLEIESPADELREHAAIILSESGGDDRFARQLEAIAVRVEEVERERDQQREFKHKANQRSEGLEAAITFALACIPSEHPEPCGTDACWLCAAETRLRAALSSAGPDVEGAVQ